MNSKGLARHYGVLTPWERLPLILAASARGGEAERDRLGRSAPRQGYVLPDYHGLGEGLLLLALFHVIELLHFTARAAHSRPGSRMPPVNRMPSGWRAATSRSSRARLSASPWTPLQISNCCVDDLPSGHNTGVLEGITEGLRPGHDAEGQLIPGQ